MRKDVHNAPVWIEKLLKTYFLRIIAIAAQHLFWISSSLYINHEFILAHHLGLEIIWDMDFI